MFGCDKAHARPGVITSVVLRTLGWVVLRRVRGLRIDVVRDAIERSHAMIGPRPKDGTDLKRALTRAHWWARALEAAFPSDAMHLLGTTPYSATSGGGREPVPFHGPHPHPAVRNTVHSPSQAGGRGLGGFVLGAPAGCRSSDGSASSRVQMRRATTLGFDDTGCTPSCSPCIVRRVPGCAVAKHEDDKTAEAAAQPEREDQPQGDPGRHVRPGVAWVRTGPESIVDRQPPNTEARMGEWPATLTARGLPQLGPPRTSPSGRRRGGTEPNALLARPGHRPAAKYSNAGDSR